MSEKLNEVDIGGRQEARAADLAKVIHGAPNIAARELIYQRDENSMLRRWHKEAVDKFVESVAENKQLRDRVAALEAERDSICDWFQIGKGARSSSILMTNVQNALRRSECLSAIERVYFMEVIEDEDGEEMEDCMLNWGSNPNQYVADFAEALKKREAQRSAPSHGSEAGSTGFVKIPPRGPGILPTSAAASGWERQV